MDLASASVTAPVPSRAAQYVRMSTEHQQYSPENQLEITRQYAAAVVGWTSPAADLISATFELLALARRSALTPRLTS